MPQIVELSVKLKHANFRHNVSNLISNVAKVLHVGNIVQWSYITFFGVIFAIEYKACVFNIDKQDQVYFEHVLCLLKILQVTMFKH